MPIVSHATGAARLPFGHALPLGGDHKVSTPEDLDGLRGGSHEVEARANGSAPLLHHGEWPPPDAFADEIAVRQDVGGGAEEYSVQVSKENVEASLQYAQSETLPLANYVQLGDDHVAQSHSVGEGGGEMRAPSFGWL